MSPYARLAAFRIDQVLPVEALWQPVWLAPLFAASGRPLPTFEEGRARRAEIVARASRYGIPEWRWPPGFEPANEAEYARWQAPNTLSLMRLATFAHQAGVGKDFARAVFHLAFGEGRDVTTVDDAVLRVASDCGLTAEDARDAPTAPDIKQALRSATDRAIERGVLGVPTVAVGDELFWGDDRLEDAAAAAETLRTRIAPVEAPSDICPHCGGTSEYQNVRYPRALCHACDMRATDLTGRPVGLTNESVSGGFVAFHRDDESPCEQVTRDGRVLIDGVEYRAGEAHMGGCVVQPLS